MIDKHGEAIESDLSMYHRIDLLDVWRGAVRPSKVLRLLTQLPPESAYSAAASGSPEWRGWTPTTVAVAALFNLTAAAATGKGRPPRYPLPGGGERRTESHGGLTSDEIVAALDQGVDPMQQT